MRKNIGRRVSVLACPKHWGKRGRLPYDRSGEDRSEQLTDVLAAIDDLERTALRREVLLARVYLEGVAERAEQVGHLDGPVLRRGAVGRAGAQHTAPLDACPADHHVEAARVVVAPRVAVDPRCPAELAHPDDEGLLQQ